MKAFQQILSACAFSVAVLAAPAATAHATLQASNPTAGAVLKVAPAEIMLTFNEKIEQAFSTVTLTNSKGKIVKTEKGKVDPVNKSIFRVQTKGLSTGTYTVKWAVAGHDGHRRTGNFSFSVN